MSKHIKITLSTEQRTQLEDFVNKGKHSVHLVRRARVILALDSSEGRIPLTQKKIEELVDLSRTAINDIKNAFLKSENIETFLQRKKRETPPVEAKITGDVEAHIIAVACSAVPEGYCKWTCQLIAGRTVALGYIDEISAMSVCRVLKKRNFIPTGTNIGASHRNKTQIL